MSVGPTNPSYGTASIMWILECGCPFYVNRKQTRNFLQASSLGSKCCPIARLQMAIEELFSEHFRTIVCCNVFYIIYGLNLRLEVRIAYHMLCIHNFFAYSIYCPYRLAVARYINGYIYINLI